MNLFKPIYISLLFRNILPWCSTICILLFIIGMISSLFFSPEDYKQGDIVKIMYLHVPSAWLALIIYGLMAIFSLMTLVWHNSIASILAHAAAPAGTFFSAICLITGSIWGKGTWGTWWVWDARLTSMLILFFMYIGYLALWNAFNNDLRAEKSAAVFNIFSAINIPITKFSVNLWSTLHQSSSIIRQDGIAIQGSLLIPLIIMFMFYITFFLVVWILYSLYLINMYKIKREINMRY
ncbi:heme ABC transporter permease CcmC [Wolbachia endosymbiont of Howardula sp.]|uniref:heme ABC transporter permease CcmC n=1 Tax=Wolbachia endosymbiont of Howardula sp. TaxID=2916816 RepID=UPI00217D56D0|nr:heme ABC transporter permease CcmC [Wolbachia endosymbiont of Howardula sp.]UWI83044.1 heme ABC transporter permease CcmC [Wolbachia endosymbiont of Howardula sp.]